MHKKITIYDIAAEANVSVATVSRVLNNNDKVAEDTRQRVQKIIENHDFKPNEVARSLFKNETKLIGFMVPDIRNPYFSNMVLEAEKYAKKHGYMIMICNTYEDPRLHAMYLQTLIERQVAGIIHMGEVSKDSIELINVIKKYVDRVPFVTINWHINDSKSLCVRSDEIQGFQDIITMLRSKGYKDVAMLTGKRGIMPHEEKIHLYKEAVENGIFNYNEGYIVDGDSSFESGSEAMYQLLDLPKRPSAVIGVNDILTVGAIKACYIKNVSVPKDIAFIGFDNVSISTQVYPSLTTVAHDYKSLATKAVDLIIDKTEVRKANRIYTYPMELISRDSC